MRLATWMSFAQAATELAHHARVTVSATTARRQTEQAGAAYEAVQTAQVAAIEREAPPAPMGPAVQQLSVDGALVPLVGGEWAEVKTLVIGTVEARPARSKRDRGQGVYTTALSYFSRLTDHETFTRLALVETHRRGTETAGQVCAVVDGALWQQGFIDTHRPDAVRILDEAHALSYVAQVGTALYGPQTLAAQTWFAQQRRVLQEETPDPVLQTLRTLHADLSTVANGAQEQWVWTVAAPTLAPSPALTGRVGRAAAQEALAVVQESLTYLEVRRDQLCYAAFRAAGYPIGSGSVESANKLVVEARLKGAGRRWARAHVNPLVALRTIACTDRWGEAWPQITTQRRIHARAQTGARRHTRLRALGALRADAPPAPTLPAASRPAPATGARVTPPVSPARHPRRTHTPAADHPWRRSHIGRPRCA